MFVLCEGETGKSLILAKALSQHLEIFEFPNDIVDIFCNFFG